jgi:hypothetical protein
MVCPPSISEAGARRPNVLQIYGVSSSNYNNPYFNSIRKINTYYYYNWLDEEGIIVILIMADAAMVYSGIFKDNQPILLTTARRTSSK